MHHGRSFGADSNRTPSPVSQGSKASGNRITGVPCCSARIVLFTSVVRMVKVSTASPGRCCERSAKLRTLEHPPALPKPGERHQPLIGPGDEPGLADRALPPPLAEPVDRNETPALRERCRERRLHLGGLGLRIDELVSDNRILPPGGDEPPAQHGEAALAAVVPDYRRVPARGKVVARVQVRRRPSRDLRTR